MPSLITAHCSQHASRESVARCPECQQSFCRECITEHDGRVICAACLRKLTRATERKPLRWDWLIRPVHWVIGLGLAWMSFYWVGRLLLLIPSEWHEGTKLLKSLAE